MLVCNLQMISGGAGGDVTEAMDALAHCSLSIFQPATLLQLFPDLTKPWHVAVNKVGPDLTEAIINSMLTVIPRSRCTLFYAASCHALCLLHDVSLR